MRQCIAFPAWMACFAAALRPKLPQCGGPEAARLLECLAELGHRPDREFLAAWCACVQVSSSERGADLFLLLVGGGCWQMKRGAQE